MMQFVASDTPVWLSNAELRKAVVVMVAIYLLLSLATGWLLNEYFEQRFALENWREAYCEQNARLWQAEHPYLANHVQEEIAACRTTSQ